MVCCREGLLRLPLRLQFPLHADERSGTDTGEGSRRFQGRTPGIFDSSRPKMEGGEFRFRAASFH